MWVTLFLLVGFLLDVDARRLGWSLTNYCRVTQGEVTRRRTNQSEAEEIRDGLARCLYSHLVDWIVNLTNMRLSLNRIVL